MALPEIDIIGAGNLATNLAPNLEQNGFIINRIYSRNIKNAEQLANRLYQAQVTDNLDFSTSSSSVFLLAVSDNAIEEIAREVVLPDNAIIAHTSGAEPLAVLGYTASPNIGVFYPLQTFSKTRKMAFRDIPILVEGDNSFTQNTLTTIGKRLTGNVQVASSQQRLMIHLAAVFAGNFTNAMLLHAQDLLHAAKVDPALLAPLVFESVEKCFAVGAYEGQTGPARRGDLDVLDRHMEMLKDLKDKQDVYELISQQILERYQHE